MSSHSSGGSYGHRIHRIEADHFRLCWTYDRYYSGSRLRFPQGRTHDTDHAGAVRFAKKWDLEEPKE